jgi:sterol 14-demethylase
VEGDDRDLLDVLISLKDEEGQLRFDADSITGMFISMMFAGHHTTSGTAAWTLIELLRTPKRWPRWWPRLDELYADGAEVSYQACGRCHAWRARSRRPCACIRR